MRGVAGTCDRLTLHVGLLAEVPFYLLRGNQVARSSSRSHRPNSKAGQSFSCAHRLMRLAAVASLAIGMCGCTTVHVYGADGVTVSSHGGLLHSVHVVSNRPVLVDERAVGVTVSSGLTVGVKRTRRVYRALGPEDCHVLVVVDDEKDLKNAAELLSRAAPGIGICTPQEGGNG